MFFFSPHRLRVMPSSRNKKQKNHIFDIIFYCVAYPYLFVYIEREREKKTYNNSKAVITVISDRKIPHTFHAGAASFAIAVIGCCVNWKRISRVNIRWKWKCCGYLLPCVINCLAHTAMYVYLESSTSVPFVFTLSASSYEIRVFSRLKKKKHSERRKIFMKIFTSHLHVPHLYLCGLRTNKYLRNDNNNESEPATQYHYRYT